MAGDLGILGHGFVHAVFPPPALDADSVVSDGLALRSPKPVVVHAFARAGFEPGQTRRPRVGSVLASLDGDGQCFDRLGVLEEMTQRTRRAGGFHADDAARVGDAGEDVLVGLEGRE